MPTARNCPECGAPLPDDAEGCCPVCAFQGAMALAAGGSEAEVAAPGRWPVSEQIGGYKLLEKIGEGGWGVVYMAEQAEPIRRRVALKVIKLGMDPKQVIARFEAERQALALMHHPNIAKILDAGITETPTQRVGESASRRTGDSPSRPFADTPSQLSPGRPYFVMELVRGIKITD